MSILRVVAEKLKAGYCKYHLKIDGKYCTTGALCSALGMEPEDYTEQVSHNKYTDDMEYYDHVAAQPETQVLAQTILREYPEMHDCGDSVDLIVNFNDWRGRTLEQIVSVLEKADVEFDSQVLP